jgi:serine/threonine protein kinase
MPDNATPHEPLVGRYRVCDEIAAGGMATVHIGRLVGSAGFSRTVAVKRLHAHLAKDPDFVTMLLDEARLAARIRHPNVVSTLDVVTDASDLLVVMDYVQGESLSRLATATFRAGGSIPLGVLMSVIGGALYGLHAAHEATSEHGEPLDVIHRDISPQNIMVGVDGVARVLDFGVARAAGRLQTTREGTLKGKLAYMSPEQVRGDSLDRRSDLFSMSVVLWEMLARRRMLVADGDAELLHKVLNFRPSPPSAVVPGLPPALDEVVMKGLCADPEGRFATALEMAEAVEAIGFATPREVSVWVLATAGDGLAARAARVAELESESSGTPLPSARAIEPATPRASRPPAPRAPLALTDPASQVSQVSVAGPVPRAVPLGIGLAVLGAVLFVGATVIAGLTLRLRAADTAPLASPASEPTNFAAPSVPSVTETGLLETTPWVETLRPPASAAGPTAFPVLRRAAPPRRSRCDPPYTVDSNGIRTPKPACL